MRAVWRRWMTRVRGCCLRREGTRRPGGPRVPPCVRSKRGTGRPSFPKHSPRTASRWRARGSTHVRAAHWNVAPRAPGREGNATGAGRGALAVVEELGGQLDFGELSAAYERAADLLAGSQQPGVKERLLSCSLLVLRRRAPEAPGPTRFVPPREWKGFSLPREVRRYERLIIERALKDAGGVVTRAAQLLGFKHHNSLISRINKRHTNLLQARSPVLPRKRGIIRDPDSQRKQPDSEKTYSATIFHVEDDRFVAETLRDVFEAEGWRVETCADGATALKRLAGDAHYDLLLFDQGPPGASGLELVRAAKRLPHRRRTPVVMLSAHDCEAEAWRAGVDAFLRKPEDVRSVAAMISRLLAEPDPDSE